jgi:hypothetical protein
LANAFIREVNWTESAGKFLRGKKKLQKDDAVSWPAYHASLPEARRADFPAVCALLPVLLEKAASVATIRHCMKVAIKITETVNPRQFKVFFFCYYYFFCCWDLPPDPLSRSSLQTPDPVQEGSKKHRLIVNFLLI